MAVIIDGKALRDEVLSLLKPKFETISSQLGRKIRLVGIICKKTAANDSYLRSQRSVADFLGIDYKTIEIKEEQAALEDTISMLNSDSSVDGVIIHTPVPETVDLFDAISFLRKEKDVEGLSALNVFQMFFRQEGAILPPTPKAVVYILDRYGIDLYGKDVLVIGEGAVVGRPLSLMLSQKGATVRISHLPAYKVGKLESYVREADVVIAAAGVPYLVKGDWIKDGAVVIDVGINLYEGRIVGDVEFSKAVEKASYITPVPGGVGPVTTSMLMENLYFLVDNKLRVS